MKRLVSIILNFMICNGSATSGVTCYLTNTKGHGWSSVTSTHTATGYSKRTLNKTESYVS